MQGSNYWSWSAWNLPSWGVGYAKNWAVRNQRWVTRVWEVMPSQSLVIGFYLGMRSHMILVVIPHDKQRYLYSSFCFQNLFFFMHDLLNFVTSIHTEVRITPCFYFKQKPWKNLHLIVFKKVSFEFSRKKYF